MKKLALVLALAAGIMMLAVTPALAAKPVPPPAPPAPALPPGGTTTQSCPTDQKVVSGKAVYSFKGKNKVTVTSYVAGGFNAFGEPTTATFTTPVEPRFDTVNITLVCAPATVAPPDADGDGVPDSSDNCPNNINPNQSDVDGDGIGDTCDPVDNRDADSDGALDNDDNCLGVYNPNQSDNDLDGIGNACDPDTPQVVHVESGYLTLEDGTGFDLLCPPNYYHDTSTLVLDFPSGINWNVITRSDGDGYLYGVRAENRVFAGDLPQAFSGSFGFDCTLI